GDTHGLHMPGVVELSLNPDHGIQLQQRERGRRIVQIDLAGLDLIHKGRGQRVRVDLESHRQRGLRAYAPAHAPVFLACDRPVQLESAGPECPGAEGGVTEYLPPFRQHLLCVLVDLAVVLAKLSSAPASTHGCASYEDGECSQKRTCQWQNCSNLHWILRAAIA